MPAVSVDQASLNALAVFLRTKLPGVDVNDRWPDSDKALPERAVTILRAGPPAEEILQPRVVGTKIVHATLPLKAFEPQATDLPTAIALANELKARWNAHLSQSGVHAATDPSVASAPDATDLATAITLANQLRTLNAPHRASTVFHPAADIESVVAANVASDLPTLLALANDLKRRINQHFAARVYTWEVRARELPLQMDVWGRFDWIRDEMIADLDRVLTDPRRIEDCGGVTLALGDGWSGQVGFTFGAARQEDTAGTQKEREYRATYRGTADYKLTIDAQSARRAKTTLVLAIGSTTPPPAATDEASVAWAPGEPGYVEDLQSEFGDEFGDEFD